MLALRLGWAGSRSRPRGRARLCSGCFLYACGSLWAGPPAVELTTGPGCEVAMGGRVPDPGRRVHGQGCPASHLYPPPPLGPSPDWAPPRTQRGACSGLQALPARPGLQRCWWARPNYPSVSLEAQDQLGSGFPGPHLSLQQRASSRADGQPPSQHPAQGLGSAPASEGLEGTGSLSYEWMVPLEVANMCLGIMRGAHLNELIYKTCMDVRVGL